MKRLLLAACSIGMSSAVLAVDVGLSITVGQPGFYGRIDIGNIAAPRLIFEKPTLIVALAAGVRPQPVYLHVPLGHAKKWDKHCHTYNACGQPVYFVQNDWYSDVYVPHAREARGRKGKSAEQGQGDHPGKGQGKVKKDKDRN